MYLNLGDAKLINKAHLPQAVLFSIYIIFGSKQFFFSNMQKIILGSATKKKGVYFIGEIRIFLEGNIKVTKHHTHCCALYFGRLITN